MAEPSLPDFNPCSLDEDEQIPAKIWELLRRNHKFRLVEQRLQEHDLEERTNFERTGKYHGTAWNRSRRLVERAKKCHPFAGVALQWLVPEPLFRCGVAAQPLGRKQKQGGVLAVRILRIGEGTTPNVKDASWTWQNPTKPGMGRGFDRRGPVVNWTTSRSERLRDRVNPILEWKQYSWPFTVEHSWRDAPAEFRRKFQFIWRSQFDCRPSNPISNDRRDSPAPREVTFLHDWDLLNFRASGQMTKEEMCRSIQLNQLVADYRVFAIPQAILTKGSAEAMGRWLADELKKGSRLHGDLFKDGLPNDGEMLGTAGEWDAWLRRRAGAWVGFVKDTHFYRRCRYMDSLVELTFPAFNLRKLLAHPPHRARGKKYVRKS